jgi:hypothetical protein
MRLILFFIFISMAAQSQTSVYHPFPDSNGVWNIETSSQCSVATATREFFSYVIDGDTLVNTHSYHKLTVPYLIDSSGCWPFYSAGSIWRYEGAFRQDIANKKVYFLSATDTIEKLLYDFNLHVGDTIRSYLTANWCDGDSIISAEDSIFINGNYRKRWAVNLMLPTPNYIIEGIGFTGGPMTPLCNWFEGGYVLTCFIQNNTVLYSNPDYPTECDVIDNLYSLMIQKEISIYPNPFKETARINLNEGDVELNIYNLYGINVYRKRLDSNSIILSREEFSPGIYYIIVNNRNGKFQTVKIAME